MKHRWSRYHPGIRMHAIPVDANTGGLIFTVGVTLVFLLVIPLAKWFLLASLGAGAVVAVFLRCLRGRE